MSESHEEHTTRPPWSWAPARALARSVSAPIERFLAIQSASGILLMLAAAIALVWANSAWSASYVSLWQTPIGVRLGEHAFERELGWWINDGLMAVFFFVVGLEIRREIHAGELSDLRRAALPLAAAVGGMIVPASIYVALNLGTDAVDGWGIPMATDIAFAVGVLTLLGQRVPAALRILLLALAVIDDVGAILVIALFYSNGIELAGVCVLAGGILGVLALQWWGVSSPWFYVVPALVVWGGAYAAGIHPTIAGVIVGLLTPVRAWFDDKGLAAASARHVAGFRREMDPHARLAHLDGLRLASLEASAPVERLQHRFHGWVAYAIMPVFALANAGVALGSADFAGQGLRIFGGVVLGLACGKLIGILGCSWLAVRLGWAVLPDGVDWRGVTVVGLVGGIGFTMSLFIAGLALPPGAQLETAKLAILAGSCLVAVVALLFGRFALSPTPDSAAALPVAGAERSTRH